MVRSSCKTSYLLVSGGVASAFFWGIVADVFGRKRVLSCTLLFDGLLTLAQSTVNDYRILVLVNIAFKSLLEASRGASRSLIAGLYLVTFSSV